MDQDLQQQPLSIDQQVLFPSPNLPRTTIARLPSDSGRLDRLAVDNPSTGLAGPPNTGLGQIIRRHQSDDGRSLKRHIEANQTGFPEKTGDGQRDGTADRWRAASRLAESVAVTERTGQN